MRNRAKVSLVDIGRADIVSLVFNKSPPSYFGKIFIDIDMFAYLYWKFKTFGLASLQVYPFGKNEDYISLSEQHTDQVDGKLINCH